MITQSKVSILTVNTESKKEPQKKYRKLSTAEALQTAKQRLTGLAPRLKRCSREAEARGINRTPTIHLRSSRLLIQG